MSGFDAIRGQDAALSVLRRALRTDRLASTYLFHGPSGVGKQRAALALAAEVVAGGDAAARARVESGHHPDVRVFGPRVENGKRLNLKVEQVREELLPFAQFAPFEARAAFVVLPEADVSFPEHQPDAANVLLKTLEEPRPNVHFLLLAERPSRLLVTIRSRCQALRFAPLPVEVVADVLSAAGIGPDEAKVAAALAGGRADRALELARSGRVDALVDRALGFHRASLGRKPGAMVSEAERAAKLDPDDRALELETLALLHRDAAMLHLGTGVPLFGHRRDDLEPLAALPVRVLGAREAAVRKVLDALERTTNPQAALDALVFELARTA